VVLHRQDVLKLRLTIIIVGLLMAAMLLMNVVLFFLWKHDALQREVKRDQAVLAHVQSLFIQKERVREISHSGERLLFSDFYDSSENGRFFFLLQVEEETEKEANQEKSISEEDQITSLLLTIAQQARASEQAVSRTAAAFPHIFSWNDLLLNAQPIFYQEKAIGAVAVVRSLDSLFLTLWQNEKTILVYMLMNILVLGTIGFFRMVSLIIRPVDRLVTLADQYNNYDPFLFVSENSGSEFGKLSKSLSSMLLRIEQDRQTLQHTVSALEYANQALKRQQDKMVVAEKLATVGRMAAGLAHEIGNPLSVVKGYLGILLASKKQSEEHRDFLGRAEQEVERIDSLIRQLLDFSRAAKGSPKLFSLHELLHSVLEMVRVQSAFRDIIIDADFTAEEDQLYADSEQLRQVFVNCLLNSADAIHMAVQKKEKKGGRIIVSTAVQCLLPDDKREKERGKLVIRIRDNGQGISEENLVLVFDPFFTTKEPGKGTGLGLSVSRSLVEAAGGTMELQAGDGQGCCMLLRFPLA
jgi:signal transduction histidine kinase